MVRTEKNTANEDEIRSMLSKLALGSVADAVRLLLHAEEMSDRMIKKLDLSAVTDIKRSSSGITEIKLCDRLKAIAMLSACRDSSSEIQREFVEALSGGGYPYSGEEDDGSGEI